jgi:hypothetical protein
MMALTFLSSSILEVLSTPPFAGDLLDLVGAG